ncbi:THAP domain-containing protein 6 [Camponotus floridanus]|uniref:THAP domain-containing protein 6 n=1 Tax=Camponotus floridanus TaxID=104421 RepID=UPI000DC683D2|nr:THAP domain-containing protein 6 [Camponotus floridanus]
MGKYCLLCGNLTNNKTVSYHRFPKDKDIRKKWLSFCGIKEEVLNTATFLCSQHFKKEDLKQKSNSFSLNTGSIPSIYDIKKKKKRSNTTDENCPTTSSQ